MAVQIYHTLKSDKGQHRIWYDSGISLRGSWSTFMAGLKHIEKKYLPSVELEHPVFNACRKQGDYCSRMTLAIVLSLTCGEEQDAIMEELDKLWALELDPRLNIDDRLFFSSLQDRAVFRAEDAAIVAQAWKKVSDEMSPSSGKDFHNLANAVLKLVNDNEDICCIGINWNSVNSFSDIFGTTDENCHDFIKYLQENNINVHYDKR